MAQDGFAWIYLVFFLIIPLSRIIPRLVQKWKMKNKETIDQYAQKSYESTNDTVSEPSRESFIEDIPSEMKPQSLDMLVLGELNRGVKNFNSIQKQELMKVVHKQGVFGPKIELIPTEKGFKKFYSQ